jgi:hypothetical protein
MTKYFQPLQLFVLVSVFILQASVSLAQKDTLPEVKLPKIDYKPNINKGWVGQFVYQLNFEGSTGFGTGNTRVFYYVKINRTNTGYVELPTEVKGAIRKNQPDKNNAQRYESWIRKGSSKCWNMHDELDSAITPTASMPDWNITGRYEKYNRYTTNSNWVEGWISNVDLQIDHVTGRYSFAVPYVEYNLEGDEWGTSITYKPEKKEPFQRKTHCSKNGNYLVFGEWRTMLDSTFKEGQTEIVIRQRIPVMLEQTTTQKGKPIKLPVKKGFMDFYLVLKRVGG